MRPIPCLINGSNGLKLTEPHAVRRSLRCTTCMSMKKSNKDRVLNKKKEKRNRRQDNAVDVVAYNGLEATLLKMLPLDVENPTQKNILTTYMPLLICAGIAMILDAAYSGDWSRIGVLSQDQEKTLQYIVVGSVVIHGAIGLRAGAISKSRGEKRWLARGFKAFIVGVVGFAEVLAVVEE